MGTSLTSVTGASLTTFTWTTLTSEVSSTSLTWVISSEHASCTEVICSSSSSSSSFTTSLISPSTPIFVISSSSLISQSVSSSSSVAVLSSELSISKTGSSSSRSSGIKCLSSPSTASSITSASFSVSVSSTALPSAHTDGFVVTSFVLSDLSFVLPLAHLPTSSSVFSSFPSKVMLGTSCVSTKSPSTTSSDISIISIWDLTSRIFVGVVTGFVFGLSVTDRGGVRAMSSTKSSRGGVFSGSPWELLAVEDVLVDITLAHIWLSSEITGHLLDLTELTHWQWTTFLGEKDKKKSLSYCYILFFINKDAHPSQIKALYFHHLPTYSLFSIHIHHTMKVTSI